MDKKKYLYIVLIRSNTFVSTMIHLVKRDKYTHSCLALDPELEKMYSFGRKRWYNPFIAVFRKEEFNLYRFNKKLPGVVLQIEVTMEQYKRATELLNIFIENSEQYKYNYKGLFYGLISRATKSKNRFLCSEFVYYILYDIGVANFNIPRNLVRPVDLLNLEHIEVYSGDLKKLEKNYISSKNYGRGYKSIAFAKNLQ